MQLLTTLHLHLPHFHPRRRRQRTSGEDVENGRSNITAPTLMRPMDDVMNDPDTFDPAFDRSDTAKTYRVLPIFSGVMIPFSIMLSIPSLTGHWYIRTEGDITTEIRPNPILLDVAMGFSMACGGLASAFLVIRFAERCVKWTTLASIAFLTLHDLINIPAVTIFGVINRFDDGFTYGQSFWFTVCSTILSTVTNIGLIVDYVNTKDFARSGSGLTQKQRSLVIVVIILLSYISFGSIIQANLLDTPFINALYFAVVTIETIGYGDIYPATTQAKIFTCFYIAGGVLNIALAVAVAREAILESAVAAFRQRLLVRQHERRLRSRWRAAVRWRLRERNLPTWVHRKHSKKCIYEERWYGWILSLGHRLFRFIWSEKRDPTWKFQSGPLHKHLNLEPLTDADLHAAALEAGAPLCKLVPEELRTKRNSESSGVPLSHRPTIEHGHGVPTSASLTHFRLGGMLAVLGNFALAVTHGANVDAEEETTDATSTPSTPPEIAVVNEGEANNNNQEAISEHPRAGVPLTITATMHEDDRSMEATLAEDVKYLFRMRLGFAFLLFLIFWAAGSAIFMTTEKWTFASAVYFCFITFTTLGYGDLSPKSPAGRSIFVVWALFGVATMTIMITVLMEAYTQQYKSIIKPEVFQRTSTLTSRPQFTEHMSFATDQGFSPPNDVPSIYHSSNTRAVPEDTVVLNSAKPSMRTVKIEEGTRSRDEVDEKGGRSFQASGLLSRSVLVQMDHLKSLITMARAQRDTDTSQRLANLISQLESALRDFDAAGTPAATSAL